MEIIKNTEIEDKFPSIDFDDYDIVWHEYIYRIKKPKRAVIGDTVNIYMWKSTKIWAEYQWTIKDTIDWLELQDYYQDTIKDFISDNQ